MSARPPARPATRTARHQDRPRRSPRPLRLTSCRPRSARQTERPIPIFDLNNIELARPAWPGFGSRLDWSSHDLRPLAAGTAWSCGMPSHSVALLVGIVPREATVGPLHGSAALHVALWPHGNQPPGKWVELGFGGRHCGRGSCFGAYVTIRPGWTWDRSSGAAVFDRSQCHHRASGALLGSPGSG